MHRCLECQTFIATLFWWRESSRLQAWCCHCHQWCRQYCRLVLTLSDPVKSFGVMNLDELLTDGPTSLPEPMLIYNPFSSTQMHFNKKCFEIKQLQCHCLKNPDHQWEAYRIVSVIVYVKLCANYRDLYYLRFCVLCSGHIVCNTMLTTHNFELNWKYNCLISPPKKEKEPVSTTCMVMTA